MKTSRGKKFIDDLKPEAIKESRKMTSVYF